MKKLLSAAFVLLLAGCSSTTPSSAVSAAPEPDTKDVEVEEPKTDETDVNESEEIEVVEQLTIHNPLNMKTKTLDMGGYQWLYDPNPAFEQITVEQSLRLYEEGGTGIVLYSYDTCPWCNRAVPVLNQAAKELGVKIYYVDVYEPEMTHNKQVYERFMKDIDPILQYEMNEETKKVEPALYTPEVVAVKNGEIVDHHTALVDSFKLESETQQMTEEQNEELKAIYQKLIREIAD